MSSGNAETAVRAGFIFNPPHAAAPSTRIVRSLAWPEARFGMTTLGKRRTFPSSSIAKGASSRVLPFAVPTLNSIVPFFIVENLQSSLDFYQSKLGFEIEHKGGGDGVSEDFWAMVRRDGVMVMLKAIAPEIHPQPNHSRHEWAAWDAYIHTSDPDSLYEEYVSRAVPMHKPLKDTTDGLRAFEVIDNNGYVLCFGRPREQS
jgi:catechol 2,3-dioxygenase-like lactoylglutathione lyase family enzyme